MSMTRHISPAIQMSDNKEESELKISTNKPPLMLGIREAAERFNISQHYCRQLSLSGTVKAVRIGKGKILVNCDSMAAFFDSATIPDQMDKTAYTSDIHPIPVKI